MGLTYNEEGKGVPKTILKEDLTKTCVSPIYTIEATLSKDKKEKLYSRAEYINEKIDTMALCLSPELRAKIDPSLCAAQPKKQEQEIDPNAARGRGR